MAVLLDARSRSLVRPVLLLLPKAEDERSEGEDEWLAGCPTPPWMKWRRYGRRRKMSK